MAEDTKTDGFRGVPGMPEGWELVRFGKAKECDIRLLQNGKPSDAWTGDSPSSGTYPIIRKIEKPKRYRPPTNADIGKPCEVKDADEWKPATYCGYATGMSVGVYFFLWPGTEQVDCIDNVVRIEVTDE